MDTRTMTGLEFLQASWDGTLPRASIGETIPMTGLELAEGFVKMSARADGRHLNPLGGVHGGFAATVLDSATACAVHTTLDAGTLYSTIDLHIKMLRPLPRDEDLIAEARVTHSSRNIATSEGTLKTQEGKLLASATATCFIKRASPT